MGELKLGQFINYLSIVNLRHSENFTCQNWLG